jgi:hypothetical protein
MRIPSPAICISALLMSSGAAVAAPGDAIGSAVTVVNYVTASLENAADERQLASGDDVRQQELIEVDQDSRSEIELNDRTKLALGPGARMLLDKFVYVPFHHRHRCQARVCHPHARRIDHRAGHDFRRVRYQHR